MAAERSLTEEDIAELQSQVQRFTQRTLNPEFDRPELLVPHDKLKALLDSVIANGIINERQNTGVGLWEQTDNPELLKMSCYTLSHFSQCNVAFALLCHQYSLIQFLVNKLALPVPNDARMALTLQGNYGLPQQGVGDFLRTTTPPASKIVTLNSALQSYYSPTAKNPAIMLGEKNWSHLLKPHYDTSAVIQFALVSREDMVVENQPHPLGINELTHFSWYLKQRPVSSVSSLSDSDSRGLIINLYRVQWLALLSIALGALIHARQLAHDYATLRRQGGCLIQKHAAIKQLLTHADEVILSTKQSIEYGISASAATLTESLESLRELALLRASLHPRISTAANGCLQVMGGMGYMQDTGLEKIVRDLMQLRLLNGSPIELQMFASELEALQ